MKLISTLVLSTFISTFIFAQEPTEVIAVKIDADEAAIKIERLKELMSGEFLMVDEDQYEAFFLCGGDCDKDLNTLNSQDDFEFRKTSIVLKTKD